MRSQMLQVPPPDAAPPTEVSVGQTQEAFIARVRRALTDRGQPVPLPVDLEIARVVRSGTDAVALFPERVQQASMNLHRVPDEDAMLHVLMDLVTQACTGNGIWEAQRTSGSPGGPPAVTGTVLMPEQDVPAGARIRALLADRNISVLDPDDPDAAFEAAVGITGVALAVAETGSMVLTSGDDRRRLASLAVPCHIGIVRREQIVPDLLDWLDRPPASHPACEVLVSGPSKTADIELALVVGVHGPKVEHIILIG